MKKPEAKRRRRKLRLLAAAFLAAAIALAVMLLLPQKQLVLEGNEYYSDEEMKELLGITDKTKAFSFYLKEKLSAHKEISLVEKYTVHFSGYRNVHITVYEKALAGYLTFQNYYLFFDQNGVLIGSGLKPMDGLYEVTGLSFSSAVVGEQLQTEDENCFTTILTISQFLNSESVLWSGQQTPLSELSGPIRFSDSGVSLQFGEIQVLLGSDEALQNKLGLMCDMLPQLQGRSGTLHLEGCTQDDAAKNYYFR